MLVVNTCHCYRNKRPIAPKVDGLAAPADPRIPLIEGVDRSSSLAEWAIWVVSTTRRVRAGLPGQISV
jgi:hypothetical protein